VQRVGVNLAVDQIAEARADRPSRHAPTTPERRWSPSTPRSPSPPIHSSHSGSSSQCCASGVTTRISPCSPPTTSDRANALYCRARQVISRKRSHVPPGCGTTRRRPRQQPVWSHVAGSTPTAPRPTRDGGEGCGFAPRPRLGVDMRVDIGPTVTASDQNDHPGGVLTIPSRTGHRLPCPPARRSTARYRTPPGQHPPRLWHAHRRTSRRRTGRGGGQAVKPPATSAEVQAAVQPCVGEPRRGARAVAVHGERVALYGG
jgi:hypothetical protein